MTAPDLHERATEPPPGMPGTPSTLFEDSRLPSEMEDLLRRRAFLELRRLATGVLEKDPSNALAGQYLERAELRLRAEYRARFGSFFRCPRLAVELAKIPVGELDRDTTYLLFLVDGRTTVSDLIDLAGRPDLDTLGRLAILHSRGWIAV
jgi:hypothetical protein